jgi:ubiquinone/menaquinone biosynthesis C-methylase UbiE
MSAAHEYVLTTDDEEVVRLGLQHRMWSEAAFGIWERAGFKPGQRLIDVGSGPGYAAFDLAQIVGPTGHVLAADVSQRFLDYLQQQAHARGIEHIGTVCIDVQKLELPPASFDGAYSRWVLCWLPDPESVVQRVARALRPGGVFAVQDYFNYRALCLAPRSAAMERLIQAILASWRARGGDDDLAGRLPAIFARHGLRVREIRPHLRVALPNSPLWHWPTSFWRSFVPELVKHGFLQQSEADEFFAEWARRSTDPHSFFCTPPVFDIIGEKE